MNTELIPLSQIAYARSGDKGSSANIGVIAYTETGFEFLRKALTVEKVASFFHPMEIKSVHLYELPNLGALNFVLEGILELGGSRSLHIDAQGKSLGQRLLEMKIEIPLHLLPLAIKARSS